MRETQEWTDWELDLLEKYHALHGTAHVQAHLARRGVSRSAYSIRHKASRLGLSHAMLEFHPLPDVQDEAGVTREAVYMWLTRTGYRQHCRWWGPDLLIPAPAVALYLHERRVPARPRGWWGTARTADFLGVTVDAVQYMVRRGHLDAVQCGTTYFIDPHDAHAWRNSRPRAPQTHVKVRALAAALGIHKDTLRAQLRTAGVRLTEYAQPGDRPALYTPATAARQFLSARGHHDEQVETLLRRALALDTARSQI